MIHRFKGRKGKQARITALKSQTIVNGNVKIANKLANLVEIDSHSANISIIQQGAADNDLYFIISGRVKIMINSHEVACRTAGTHVGEMALVDIGGRRSASVVATEETITAKITAKNFCRIANCHPEMWRYVATELSQRLRERSKFIRFPNLKPRLFIGSSKESKHIVDAMIKSLDKKQVKVVPWTKKDIFRPSISTIEELEELLPEMDFSVMVFGPDDNIESRTKKFKSPRDNVILEFGISLGAIGRERTYYLIPRQRIKIPSDLIGLKAIKYDKDKQTGGPDVKEACAEIMSCVKRLKSKIK
jgi:CRP/FNR family transcriptional regulator, cyclic AMP receptor protein